MNQNNIFTLGGRLQPMPPMEALMVSYMNMWTISFGLGVQAMHSMAQANPFLPKQP
jgi:hypothetical protein